MKKAEYEHKVHELIDLDPEKEQSWLNALGLLGWQLVAMTPTGSIRRRFYLKRRKVSLPEPKVKPPLPPPPPPRRTRG
jgi:hypothetical protein